MTAEPHRMDLKEIVAKSTGCQSIPRCKKYKLQMMQKKMNSQGTKNL
jgi:hypothetical protein